MTDKRKIRVFIASPGDLSVERQSFRKTVEMLNQGFGDGAGVEFVPLGWEDTLSTVGRRSQSVINRDIDTCDVFILTLHRRWGQEAPDSEYSSYTEEEFHRALDRFRKSTQPEIFVFFKKVDAASMADPGPQLSKVLEFRRSLEESHEVLYRLFEDENGFQEEIDRHLRAYARGEHLKPGGSSDKVLLPLEYRKAVEEAKKAAQREGDRVEELASFLAEQAADLALSGRIEQARQSFARATEGTVNPEILRLAVEFYYRTGELSTAEELVYRIAALASSDLSWAAVAYSWRGLIYLQRGELDKAEETHRKALETDERLGHQQGMATCYGNLGVIYNTRGDLDRAEEMHRKALEIHERLGHQRGMARHYGNLGVIYKTRGDSDNAEEMLCKALEIHERLGHQQGVAADYGNLGVIYKSRGDLEKAEEMHRKALEIHERLGDQEGIAIQYGNLGQIYERRGELDKAEEMCRKALEINERLGRQAGMAVQIGNLGMVCQKRGDLDKAEEMRCKALEINERLGNQEEIAVQCGNLGQIYEQRGDLDKAEEMFRRSRNLYQSIGASDNVRWAEERLSEIRAAKK
jgi:tetratricopeptide (TPR) repeat protein